MKVDQKKLEHIKSEIVKCAAYANYWTHFATSQTNYNRKVKRGNVLLTQLELEKEAFDTALNHIKNIEKLQQEIININFDDE